jgi:hypothetical protein
MVPVGGLVVAFRIATHGLRHAGFPDSYMMPGISDAGRNGVSKPEILAFGRPVVGQHCYCVQFV